MYLALKFVIVLLILIILLGLLNKTLLKLHHLFFANKNSAFRIFFEALIRNRFFSLLGLLLVTIWFIQTIGTSLLDLPLKIQKSIQLILIVGISVVVKSVTGACKDYILQYSKAKWINYKALIQVVDLIVFTSACLLIISLLTGKNVSELLLLFGGGAAFILLVFGDVIPAFTASLKLSLQDMLCQGDWIEIPSKPANGTVIDINLNTIRVENRDKSLSLIPVELLAKNYFINWRGMEQGDARLFQRTFSIDESSVKPADINFLNKISENLYIKELFDKVFHLCTLSSGQSFSNLALYRAYLEVYLYSHPDINENQRLFVRYEPNIFNFGIKLEIFAYSRQISIISYDEVQRSVMEHIVTTVPLFELQLFQKTAGKDLHHQKLQAYFKMN